jgi:hypothetical protein
MSGYGPQVPAGSVVAQLPGGGRYLMNPPPSTGQAVPRPAPPAPRPRPAYGAAGALPGSTRGGKRMRRTRSTRTRRMKKSRKNKSKRSRKH